MTVPGSEPLPPTRATTPLARDLYLILFPSGYEDRVVKILDEIGVPGYSEGPNLIGRGEHGRHFNSTIWPGATGEIFTAIDPDQALLLVALLRGFEEDLERESGGKAGIHVLSWPCQQLL